MTLPNDIRMLMEDEVPLLLPMARSFYKESGLRGHVNDEHFVGTLKRQILGGMVFVFVGGIPARGTIAGVISRDLASGELCCTEHFWYVDSSERGSLGVRLFHFFEKEATRRGAKRFIMSHILTNEVADTEKFTKFYDRNGYREKERIFMKELPL